MVQSGAVRKNHFSQRSKHILTFPSKQKEQRTQKDLQRQIQRLLDLGWVTWEDDGEVYFAKHFENPEAEKKRTIFQLLSSPHLGTGLYAIKRNRKSLQIREVYNAKDRQKQLKVSLFDFDALHANGVAITLEEMGKESFFAFLLDKQIVTSEELSYFTNSESKRKQLSSFLPRIILDDISGDDMLFV